ncbi:MAG: hypothetical protein M9894_12585 [Planctomycetes bacterium]|nr:hypothetical protein [Planctomycetota bacterium]
MTERWRRARWAACALPLLALAASGQEEGGFQDHLLRFAGALQAAGDPGLAALEAWDPARDPPGALGDVARRVAALPLGPDAPARLAALVGRDDPFLQEAGLVVARGQVEQGLVPGVAEAVAGPAARAVRAEGVDPWVVLAVVELVDTVGGGAPLEELLAALAEAAARGPSPIDATRAGPAGSRMRPVTGEAYARLDDTLGRWLGQAGAADAKLLAHLERRHGARGLEATRRAASLEAAVRRVHVALAQGDRRGAAWALDQARTLAEGGPRADEVERLGALVGAEAR